MAGRPQRRRDSHDGIALALGESDEFSLAFRTIAAAGMRHDAPEFRVTRRQDPCDLQDRAIARPQPGAMAVTVDLDHGGNRLPGLARRLRHGLGLGC